MKTEHPIDQYFKKGVQEHQKQPSPAAWEKIEAELQTGNNNRKAGAFYLMRAAVIVLLVGISSLFYFQRNENSLIPGNETVVIGKEADHKNKNQVANPEKKTQKQKTEEPVEAPEKGTSQKEERKEEPAPSKSKVIPIGNPSPHSSPILVNAETTEQLPETVEESQLQDEAEMELTASLEVEESQAVTRPAYKVRVKLTPATGRAFYEQPNESENNSQQAEEGKDIKERLVAYASDQFDNLRSGRALELPKTSKPQLEINLDKLF